jgi:hypothetical protein
LIASALHVPCLPAGHIWGAGEFTEITAQNGKRTEEMRNDRTIQPDCERFLAKRMGATTTEIASSHVVMLSQPQVVIDVIRKAIRAAQGVTAAA